MSFQTFSALLICKT